MVDELIATAINSEYLMDCSGEYLGGLIAATDAVNLTYFDDLSISDDAEDELISADDGDSTGCADTNVHIMLLMD